LRVFETASEEDTIALGRSLAPELHGCVLLIGNLGAGKTTLTKGIVEGLGVAPASDVTSPTFTLVHQYAGNVFHIDLYRLDEPAEVETLGLDDLFNSGALVLLEWAERFPALLPATRTEVRIEARDDDSRRITIETFPSR
jgi:tRNA threonylcarbamoyladenosine biosynthesis protein TsaE